MATLAHGAPFDCREWRPVGPCVKAPDAPSEFDIWVSEDIELAFEGLVCAHVYRSPLGWGRAVEDTAPRGEADRLGELFRELAEKWREETKMLSSVEDIVVHPCYQRIIGLGREVLPYLIRELESRPRHWFWALRAITGTDPVPPEHRGRVPEMARAWIAWARRQGLHW